MSDAAVPTTPPPPANVMPEPPPPVVRTHAWGEIEYTSHAGHLPIRNEKGEIEAQLFFMSYHRNGADPETRPMLFSFNGGPGSSSVWLHLGAVGPKHVAMRPDGSLPKPPYPVEDNPDSWFPDFDVCFIDPVGTGYSRAATPELAEKFWGLEGDIASVGEFVRLYLTRFQRWNSPVYLVGESYGTTRAAGLAAHLLDFGIALNGIILVSSVLNFQTLDFTHGNDLPYALFLPTYAATAHFHVAAGVGVSLSEFVADAERFANGEYAQALHRGDRLSKEDRQQVLEMLGRFTGLSHEYLDRANLRPRIFEFCTELRRTQGETVGRLDSRFTGRPSDANAQSMEFDPAMSMIRPPYTAAINDWIRNGLGFETDELYNVLGEGKATGKLWEKWDWGSARKGFPDVSRSLRDVFAKNPYVRVLIASGYYDLATPFAATDYTLDHMGIATWRSQVDVRMYEAGHMMYIDHAERSKLRRDVAEWMAGA